MTDRSRRIPSRPAPGPALELRLRECLRRGVDWVAEEAQRWTPDDAVPALAAAGLAARRVGASAQLDTTLRAVVARIEHPDVDREVDWSAHGGEVSLSFALILQERSIECRSLRRFLESVAEALMKEPAAQREVPEAVDHMAALELLPASAIDPATATQPRIGPPRQIGREQAVEVATWLVELTEGNPARFDGDESEWLVTGETLALSLIDACREYRLGEAAALLRGLVVLGWASHRIVIDAVDFLVRQQTFGGGFGYTASDDDHARAVDQRRWTQSLLVALSAFDDVSPKSQRNSSVVGDPGEPEKPTPAVADARMPPEARRGLLLLARLAGDERASERLTPAPFGSSGFAWLADRRIDALLDDNPLQSLYDRIWTRQRAALVAMMTALERRGIEALTFKGVEFHLRYFKDRALGGMVDADILVRARDVEAAREELHTLGYRHGFFDYQVGDVRWFSGDEVAAQEENHYELAPLLRVEPFDVKPEEAALLAVERIQVPVWRRPDVAGWWVGINVDIHHAVATNIPGDPFFSSADPGTCGAGLSMSASDLLWFTTSRYYSEVGTLAKRSLRDLAYVIPVLSDAVDWGHVTRAAAEYDLGASLYYPLAFLRRALGAVVPDEALDASSPLTTSRRRDWGWQLGVLFDFVEPLPL